MSTKYLKLLTVTFVLASLLYFVNQNYSKGKKFKYIGIKKCESICHKGEKKGSQLEIWQKSLHSKAFTTLASERAKLHAKNAGVEENPQESEKCLKCHTAGGDLEESHFTETYQKEDGVCCEYCHGTGSDYKSISIMKSEEKFLANGGIIPTEETCLKCHNDSVHPMHEFKFGEKFKIIAHLIPEKK